MADDDPPHSQLQSLLEQSIASDGDLSFSTAAAPEDDSFIDGESDAEIARREELRKLWDKSAPNLEEIAAVDFNPVVLSDAEILARAVCTPDDGRRSDMPSAVTSASVGVGIEPGVLARRYRAQRTICRVWRRYSHIRVFAYFKQLIGFKHHGHPVALLRCICPQEAALVADPSSGMFVRFRLAGDKFPPLIVYKLFTSVPVQDIGAFAPRDYTKVKGVTAQQRHNYVASDRIPKTCGLCPHPPPPLQLR